MCGAYILSTNYEMALENHRVCSLYVTLFVIYVLLCNPNCITNTSLCTALLGIYTDSYPKVKLRGFQQLSFLKIFLIISQKLKMK